MLSTADRAASVAGCVDRPVFAVALFGPKDSLPWAEGVTYIAPDPHAQALWLPTYQRAPISPDLYERAVRRVCGVEAGRIVVFPLAQLVVPLADSAKVTDDWLRRARAAFESAVSGPGT